MGIERTGLHIRMDTNLHRTAKAMAAARGLKLGEFVELAIQHYIDADCVIDAPDMVVDDFKGE